MTGIVNNNKKQLKHPAAKLLRVILSLCSILIVGSPGPVLAQTGPKAADDRKLVQLLAAVKNADGYAYQTRLQSTIVGDTQKTPVQTTLNYGSRSAFVMYSKSDMELVFLCSTGQFKVDETHKEVYYRIFQDDSELHAVKQFYLGQLTGTFDSIFLTGAIVNRKKLEKNKVSYELSYPKTAAMKEFKIQAKMPEGSPERVEYSIERPLNQNINPILVRQKLTMDHYSHGMPPEVVRLLNESKDLLAFLQKKYPSYTFRKI